MDTLSNNTKVEYDLKNNKLWENYDQEKLDKTFKSTIDPISGVRFYCAEGEPFKFLVHTIPYNTGVKGNGSNAEDLEKIKFLQENLYKRPSLFVDSDLDTPTISCSTICDKGTPTFGLVFKNLNPKNIIVGFNEDNIENFYNYCGGDNGIYRTYRPTTYDHTVEYLFHERINYSEYDEVLLSRKGRKPDYIISLYPPSDYQSNIYNILWAKVYQVPIIYINRAAYISKHENVISTMLQKMDNGVCIDGNDYERINKSLVALSTMGGSVSYSIKIYDGIKKVLQTNLTEENAKRFLSIKKGRLAYSYDDGYTYYDEIYDAVIVYYHLKEKYPFISREEMVSKLKELKGQAVKKEEFDLYTQDKSDSIPSWLYGWYVIVTKFDECVQKQLNEYASTDSDEEGPKTV